MLRRTLTGRSEDFPRRPSLTGACAPGGRSPEPLRGLRASKDRPEFGQLDPRGEREPDGPGAEDRPEHGLVGGGEYGAGEQGAREHGDAPEPARERDREQDGGGR